MTQVVAGVATLVLVLLGVQAMKTAIKYNVLNCVEALDGEKSVVLERDLMGEISTGYIHA